MLFCVAYKSLQATTLHQYVNISDTRYWQQQWAPGMTAMPPSLPKAGSSSCRQLDVAMTCNWVQQLMT